MAGKSNIWSRYVINMSNDDFDTDLRSPEEVFQQLMQQLAINCGGKRIFILEKIGPDSFIMTYEWKLPEVEKKELHHLFSSHTMEELFPGIWDRHVVETDEACAATLMRSGNVIGLIGVEKEAGKPIHALADSLHLLSFFVSTLLYSWKLIERLHTLGYRDTLTGVGNFNSLLAALDKIPDTSSLGVIFADVSGLKHINDNYGHEAGNQLLLKATSTFGLVFGNNEIFRVGGDEFIMICSGIGESLFEEKVAEIKMALKAREVDVAMGSVWVPQFSMDFSVLKDKADRRMYEEKRAYYRDRGQELAPYESGTMDAERNQLLTVNCDTVPSPFMVFKVYRDPRGTIVNIKIKVVNKAFADLFGMTPDKWVNRTIMPLLKAPKQPLWQYIHKVANERQDVTFRMKSRILKNEMMISMKMTSRQYGTLVMMPIGSTVEPQGGKGVE